MKSRCLNSKTPDFPDYGGRGIQVCEQWLTFTNFFEDMGARPSPLHTIGRLDNDGNYEKNNCEWVTNEEQQNNKRTTVWVRVEGELMSLAMAIRRLGLKENRIRARIRRSSSPQDAITSGVRRSGRRVAKEQ